MRSFLAIGLIFMTTGTGIAAEPVLLHAAGSLRGALTEASRAFEAQAGTKVTQVYRPSGRIRNAIAGASGLKCLPPPT